MVQVFDMTPTPSSASMIGNALGQGMAKNFVPPEQLVQRGMLKKALQESKAAVGQPGATPLDKIFSFMEAGAGIPGSERYMGALLPLVQQLTQAEASQNAPFGLEDQSGQGQELSNFLKGTQENQPNLIPPQNQGVGQTGGNLPQAATTGNKQPVLSNQDLLKLSKPYAAERTKAGIPTTPVQAYEELKAINQDNKEANSLVEQERKERVMSQSVYGGKGQQALLKVMPEATDEQQAILKRKGEEYAGQNKSEAEIDKLLAKEAVKFKNQIANIRKDLSAPRSYSTPYRKVTGSYKTLDEAMKSARTKVKPLLDLGLYDTARNLLSDAGYYPEERETIINPLSDQVVSQINQVPKFAPTIKKPVAAWQIGGGEVKEYNYSPEDRQILKNNMKDVFTKNPGISPALVRKVYEDQGYDWRGFEQAWNDLMEENALPNLSVDQINQADSILKSPPLGNLESILYDLGFIGR